jgi:hypothetical protein
MPIQEQPLHDKIALAKRMRGLTPLGSDRLHRTYFVIPSMPDIVFVQRLAFPARDQAEIDVEYLVEEWPAQEVRTNHSARECRDIGKVRMLYDTMVRQVTTMD